MIRRIDDFLATYEAESGRTKEVLGALTDASLGQAVAVDHRTLARIAWHIAQTIPEMLGKTGLTPAGPGVYGPSKEEWSTYGMEPPAI